MKNILGTTEDLIQYHPNGRMSYEFKTYSDGFSYEYTRDEKGKILTYKDSNGFSYESTYDEQSNILTYKNSDGFSCEYT